MLQLSNRLVSALAVAATMLAACGDDDGGGNTPTPDAAPGTPDAGPPGTPDATPAPQTINVPAGDIAASTTWNTGNTYVLQGKVYVTGTATLTIQAGTTIKGVNGSALVITSTAKIDAQGTAASPIVFTSNQLDPAPQDWGGVVLLGKAPINTPDGTALAEGFPASENAKIGYGGTDAAHNCGTLKYVRIEYGGFKLNEAKEINNLTINGCGTATVIDYIQAHKGSDDGVELFGGTVDLKHIVISQVQDDGLDWDFGWSGKVQFLIVVQDESVALDGYAVEASNNPNNLDAAPRSAPVIWNATFIGAGANRATKGLFFKEGTAGKITNAIVLDFKGAAMDLIGADVAEEWTAKTLDVKSTLFFNAGTVGALWPDGFEPANQADTFNEALEVTLERANKVDVNPALTAAHTPGVGFAKPAAGSAALTGGATPPAAFDTTATFYGAIGATDWTAGWTAYP